MIVQKLTVMNIRIVCRGSNIWNKRFSSKQDRNVSCRLYPITRTTLRSIIIPNTKYLIWVLIAMVALTNTFKGTIKKTVNLQKIRGQLLDIKKDHKWLTDAKSSLESLSKNFDHIDQCFLINETVRDGNSHI